MITLEDIKGWAAGIAASQGTASPEEEAIAHRIRTEDPRLQPLSTWACFAHDKRGPFPWMAVVNGPEGYSYHADGLTFIELANTLLSTAVDEIRREREWSQIESRKA